MAEGVQVPCVIRFKRSGKEVEVAHGTTLLEVAEAQGVKLSSLCRGGTCGTCRVRLISGQPQIDSLHALNKVQRATGWILACSARAAAGQRIVLDA